MELVKKIDMNLQFTDKKWILIDNDFDLKYVVLNPNTSINIDKNYQVFDSFSECLNHIKYYYFCDVNNLDMNFSQSLIKKSLRLTKEEIKQLTMEQLNLYIK